MKYRWYYIEVFRDAKERFEKQKTAGAEIPQQSLLEGAFEYLDHSMTRIRPGDTGWRAAVVTVISVPICTGY